MAVYYPLSRLICSEILESSDWSSNLSYPSCSTHVATKSVHDGGDVFAFGYYLWLGLLRTFLGILDIAYLPVTMLARTDARPIQLKSLSDGRAATSGSKFGMEENVRHVHISLIFC
jgi:hypothetical protein